MYVTLVGMISVDLFVVFVFTKMIVTFLQLFSCPGLHLLSYQWLPGLSLAIDEAEVGDGHADMFQQADHRLPGAGEGQGSSGVQSRCWSSLHHLPRMEDTRQPTQVRATHSESICILSQEEITTQRNSLFLSDECVIFG